MKKRNLKGRKWEKRERYEVKVEMWEEKRNGSRNEGL
jgi:hypothetical protein